MGPIIGISWPVFVLGNWSQTNGKFSSNSSTKPSRNLSSRLAIITMDDPDPASTAATHGRYYGVIYPDVILHVTDVPSYLDADRNHSTMELLLRTR